MPKAESAVMVVPECCKLLVTGHYYVSFIHEVSWPLPFRLRRVGWEVVRGTLRFVEDLTRWRDLFRHPTVMTLFIWLSKT